MTEYGLADGIAQISDDTQMVMFTANGLPIGTARGSSGSHPGDISRCDGDRLKAQTVKILRGCKAGDAPLANH